MAKSVNTAVLDAALQYIIDNGLKMTACNAEPTTYDQANSTYALADVTLDSGDYSLGAGSPSGRRVTIAAQSSITIDTSGTANHIALIKTTPGSTALIYVTTCNPLYLTSGQTMTFGEWYIEIRNPT